MYVTIDEQQIDVTKMTKGFLSNAITRYEALLRDGKDYSVEYATNKLVYEELLAERKARHRRRFTVLI